MGTDIVAKSKRRRRGPGRLILKLVSVVVLLSVSVVWVLRWYPPLTSAFMLRSQYFSDNGGTRIAHRWAPWERISPLVALAVIAAEDQKFPRHWGFDLQQIRNAVRENKHRSHARGASTITQQVAKNLFLWPGRSYVRKGLEVYFTVVLELLWSKQRILEVYLNIAEFAPGVFGVAAASTRYFAKSTESLDADDAALLAAVLPNPRRLKLSRPTPYLRTRAQWIRRQMDQLGGVRYLDSLAGMSGHGFRMVAMGEAPSRGIAPRIAEAGEETCPACSRRVCWKERRAGTRPIVGYESSEGQALMDESRPGPG